VENWGEGYSIRRESDASVGRNKAPGVTRSYSLEGQSGVPLPLLLA
jgi:hypothetical protein